MKSDDPESSNKKFNLGNRLKSFRNAFSGISTLLRYEHNSRIHLFLLIVVVSAGLYLRISPSDWIAIVIAVGLVFISECFNTAIEYLSDVASPGFNEKIKRAKDVAAAGVLISAIVAVMIGLIVFLPEVFSLING